ncbi:MAG TPA: hypothetical protein VMU06_07225 [Stellaceae bacterium]|nr:hypothetical protein [Stellaceae bacterium]
MSSLTTGIVDVMDVLTQSALDNAAKLAQYRFGLVQQRLQDQFNKKVADLKAQATDPAVTNFLQVEISAAGAQKAKFDNLRAQSGTNANILTDLQGQIAALQTAASAGDGAGFDAALANANDDVSGLAVIPADPALQPDGIEQLKSNGLAVKPSAAYGLGTPEGQAAALADLNAAQNLIAQIFQATTGNQTVAGSIAQAADGQRSALNDKLQTIQFNDQTQVALQTLQLKTQFQTQVHLIELSFANSANAAASLQQQQLAQQQLSGPPTPGTIFSLFA